jgi:hypothetical protein
MDTSDICVPDTWLKRDLHALASASGEGAFSCVCSVVRSRKQCQEERRPLASRRFGVLRNRPSRMHTAQSLCTSTSVLRHFVIRCVT